MAHGSARTITRKVNGVLRYSRGDNRNGFSLTGTMYSATWDSTDQVARRAIASGLIPRFGFLDPSDGGHANRQSVSAEIQRSMGSGSIRAAGFLLHNRLNLFSNFTYYLDDPMRGDQFEQAEQRVAAGGRVTYRRLGHLFERHTESAVGVQLRRDWLTPVGLYRTERRQRLSTTREDRVEQTMISAGVTVEPSQRFFGSLRVRHVGPRALVEDGSARSAGTTLWNGELGYRVSPRARVILQGFNLFDAEVSDIDYFYVSRLPGEPLEGVEDVHTHPAIPRSIRVGVEISF